MRRLGRYLKLAEHMVNRSDSDCLLGAAASKILRLSDVTSQSNLSPRKRTNAANKHVVNAKEATLPALRYSPDKSRQQTEFELRKCAES